MRISDMDKAKTKIYAYKVGSQSAIDLAGKLGVKILKHKGSQFKPEAGKTVINWGSSTLDEDILDECLVLNHPFSVNICSNKLNFFKTISRNINACLPQYTSDLEVAKDWVNDGEVVFCRTVLNGHSGEGIVVATREEEIVQSPLYTKYIPKKDEYRVHVIGGEIALVQRKARKADVPDDEVNWRIRNLVGGFIFAKNEDRDVPPCVLAQALVACQTLGLDFGAVDIIYNMRQDRAYLLEVNTAPGLAGTTVDVYAEGIAKLIDQKLP